MLQAVSNEFSLGSVPLNAVRNFKYTVINTSDKLITINKLTVSCGTCTKASMDTAQIPPNGKADVNVIYTPNSTGLNRKRISIDYNVGTAHVDPCILYFDADVKQI